MDVRLRHTVRVAGLLCACIGSLYQLSLLARLHAGRLRYPWDIEWLESSALYQAYRVMHGLPTYGPFKQGYIPLNHPPGYPMMLALLGKLFGLGQTMGRNVSLLFFLLAAALVMRALLHHSHGRLEGLALGAIAVGCSAAGVPSSDGFYDLVREDTMALFLCVLGATLADAAPRLSPRRIAALTLTLTAIVYTRQPAVFFGVWLVLFVFLRDRRSGLHLALAVTACCTACLVALQVSSHGYYWTLTVALIRVQPVIAARFREGFKVIFDFAPFILAIPLLVLALATRLTRRNGGPRRLSSQSVLWVGMFAASLPASLLPFAKRGGFSNDFLPTVFLIGPAAAFLISDLLAALADRPRTALAVQTSIFAAAAVLLGVRGYDPARFVPTVVQIEHARAFDTMVAALDGGVICSRHPFAPIRDGHDTLQWSDMPYLDMRWSGYSDLALGPYIERTHAKWALVAGVEIPVTARELATRYRLAMPVVDAPPTLIGDASQIRYLLRRDDEEKSPRVVFDFEGDLAGWKQSGDTFQIVPSNPSWQNPIYGVVGQRLLSSYHPARRDAATGTITSPSFNIDRPNLSLRVSGSRPATRVELRVGGVTQRSASGIFQEQELLSKVVWDVAALAGQQTELVLIDEDTGSWGHLLVDQVVLY